MKTRILLVNFKKSEQEIVSKLGVDVDLGYLSNAYTIPYEHPKEQHASFYSPYAIYNYKAIFIKLTGTPPSENQLKDKAKVIGEKEKVTFLKYWYEQRGILGIFTEDGDLSSLDILGIYQAKLTNSRGNDKTVFFSLKANDRPLRNVLEEIVSLVIIPPKKYVDVKQYRSKTTEEKNWTIFPTYENGNDDKIGIYLNWGHQFSDIDEPAFLILPPFKTYPEVITKLLKAYARIFPKDFPEISDLDWIKSNKYYPKEVSLIDNDIKQLVEETEGKIKILKLKKEELKQDYSYLSNLLTESGDKLKEAVIKTLTKVFKINAEDADESKKTDLREDILIQDTLSPPILAEVKGTKKSCPSFTYIAQVLSNLLKERDKYPDAIGGLILNFDRDKEPTERSDAYRNADEEKQLAEIVYIDTRVLFDLSMAVIDQKMPVTEAKSILFQRGRVSFNLSNYLKEIKKGKETS